MHKKISQARINAVYRDGRLYNATYHGDIWTTNTYIAERGEIKPRIYKSTIDFRADTDRRPKMESIIDNPVTVERVTAAVDTDGKSSIVTTDGYNYPYSTLYISYLVDKYGLDNLLLEPLGRTSRITAHDDDGNVLAVLMGLQT